MNIYLNITRKTFSFLILTLILFIILNIQCSSNNVEANLRINSEKLNKLCPITIDAETTLLSTSVTCDKCLLYLCQFDFDVNTLNIEEFISAKKLFLINGLRTAESMKSFRNNRVIVQYQYVNLDGIYLPKIEILPEEYL